VTKPPETAPVPQPRLLHGPMAHWSGKPLARLSPFGHSR
jgi:hypothetical protein